MMKVQKLSNILSKAFDKKKIHISILLLLIIINVTGCVNQHPNKSGESEEAAMIYS